MFKFQNYGETGQIQSRKDLKDELRDAVRQTFEEELSKTILGEKKLKNEGLLTNKDLQKIFDITLVTIHNWRKRGILKAITIGGRVYYKKSDIDELINQKSISMNGGEYAKQN